MITLTKLILHIIMYNLITHKYLKLSIQDKHCVLKNNFPNPSQLYHFCNYKVKLEILCKTV